MPGRDTAAQIATLPIANGRRGLTRLIHGSEARIRRSLDTNRLGSSFEMKVITSARRSLRCRIVASLRRRDQRRELEARFSQYQDRWLGSASRFSRKRFGKCVSWRRREFIPSAPLQRDHCRGTMNSADSRRIHQASPRRLLRTGFASPHPTCFVIVLGCLRDLSTGHPVR